MTNAEKALQLHKEWNGKFETTPKMSITTREDLALAYTPGVAEPCKVIAKDKEAAYTYTIKSNTIAVVSDGSAVLGLGNIGAHAAMPVMEGKAVLFKSFGGVNAVPICLDTQDTEEIIKTVVNIAPAFGGINLEDISAPRCFEIESRLKELLDIPVFHDDQHGTAIVVLAGIINGLKVTGKTKEECKVVINGAGSAGVAITKLLLTYGFKNVTMCDKSGILSKNSEGLNWMQKSMMDVTNLEGKTGSLADALAGADVFVGVSAPNIVTADMVKTMNKDAIIFAMANPVPEIMPDVAKAAGARVVGTGRSDFPNQVNNVIAFPGIFKGALQGRATQITEEMKLAAALAIANLIPDSELSDTNILPEAFDPKVTDVVAKAVMDLIKKYMLPYYYSLNEFLQKEYGHKLYKLALNGGMTCPNRDGLIDTKGCIFCSAGGSGDFAGGRKSDMDINTQIDNAKALIKNKYNGGHFIAYFQSFTNTYADIDYLRNLYMPVIRRDDIDILSIATRPDCIDDKVLDLLAELSLIKPVWVELGLQTTNENTARYIRRGYPLKTFDECVSTLRSIGIRPIVHMIAGLPNENMTDMLNTADYIAHCGASGIKIQLLHILQGTDLCQDYDKGLFNVLSLEEYMDIAGQIITHLPPDMVVHRITGDGPKSILKAPLWSSNKKLVLNSLNKHFKDNNIYQGRNYV